MPVTGQFGAVTATSNIAVGARVAHCAAGIGAVLTQHRTDPRLGPRGLALLRSGCSAQETVDALVASTPHAQWRQLAVVDAAGGAAAFSGGTHPPGNERGGGARTPAPSATSWPMPGCPRRCCGASRPSPAAPLAERLMCALEDGLAAGGEHGPVRSAHLLVVDSESFPLVDLRVDWHDAPIAELRRVVEPLRAGDGQRSCCARWIPINPLAGAAT